MVKWSRNKTDFKCAQVTQMYAIHRSSCINFDKTYIYNFLIVLPCPLLLQQGDPWKNYMNGKNNDEKIKLKQITVNHLYLIHNISLQDLYKCMSNLPISRDKDSAINLCELSTITFSNSTNWLINCLLFNIWSIV